MSQKSAVRARAGAIETKINVQMAEWSKAPDSSSGLGRGVGSNPTLDSL